jgi:hypothetical protein
MMGADLVGQAPISVFFACSGCKATYEATQHRGLAKGSFRCTHCQLAVHVWSGPYDYLEWRPFESDRTAAALRVAR